MQATTTRTMVTRREKSGRKYTQRRCAKSPHSTSRHAVSLLLLLIVSASARTFGGTRSTASPLSFGLVRPDNNNYQTIRNSVLNLRGGSSIGGGSGGSAAKSPFSYRPTPRKNSNPFGKTKESEPPNRVQNQQSPGENVQQDEEQVKEMIDAFLTRDSRNSFIARVYGILSVQLVFTALVCLLFGTYPPLTNIFILNSLTGQASPFLWIPLAGVFVSTLAYFRLAISPQARQKAPNKWWWLSIFTIGEAISIGALSSLYKLRSVVTAMGVTALAATTVSVYTTSQQNSKYDLSQWGATLSSWATILLVYLMIGVAQEIGWLPRGFLPYSDMMYSCFATGLFSLFLAYHTKLIVGGKHSRYRMNEKDYVLGAIVLYVDIVNIFLNILQLMGQERDR